MQETQTKEITRVANPIIRLDRCTGFAEAQKIAAECGGRLPTKSEFIKGLKDPEQYKKFSGGKWGWCWLGDEGGIGFFGCAKIDYEKGDIVKVTDEEFSRLPKEQRAYVWEGNGPSAICVECDNRYKIMFDGEGTERYSARVTLVKFDSAAPDLLQVKRPRIDFVRLESVTLDSLQVKMAKGEYDALAKILQPGQIENIGKVLKELERQE